MKNEGLIVPIEDDDRNVRWWQYHNSFGTKMTVVVDRETGRKIESNNYGDLTVMDLDKLVSHLRK
jgi:hypothetical protein